MQVLLYVYLFTEIIRSGTQYRSICHSSRLWGLPCISYSRDLQFRLAVGYPSSKSEHLYSALAALHGTNHSKALRHGSHSF